MRISICMLHNNAILVSILLSLSHVSHGFVGSDRKTKNCKFKTFPLSCMAPWIKLPNRNVRGQYVYFVGFPISTPDNPVQDHYVRTPLKTTTNQTKPTIKPARKALYKATNTSHSKTFLRSTVPQEQRPVEQWASSLSPWKDSAILSSFTWLLSLSILKGKGQWCFLLKP